MRWTRGTENHDVIDRRGRRAGAMRLTGGGLVMVMVVVVAARLLGLDLGGLVGGGPAISPRDDQAPPRGPGPDGELVDFVKFVMKDIQGTFEAKSRARGQPYRHAKLVLFSDEVDTGCGPSSKEVGPFYCPADEHAYIDLSFYRELRQRFGAPGDFAQAYVLAHEVGHHLQKLLGDARSEPAAAGALRRGHAGQAHGLGRNEASVRTELQADCFAGVWGHEAQGRNLLEAGDVEEALTAAAAIGDDRLQQQAGREVQPEAFTHGSSAQRVRWFREGLKAGRFEACDTFSTSEP